MLYSYRRSTSVSIVDSTILIADTESGNRVELTTESSLFVDAIGYAPQSIDTIAEGIAAKCNITDVETVKEDVYDFLQELMDAGLAEESEDFTLRELHINLTERCNERCIHCYIPMNLRKLGQTLSADDCKTVIRDFVSLGGKSLSLSGGEALLYKDIIDIVRYASSLGLQVGLLSNLTLLNPDIIEALKECNVSDVQVSLYSVLPEEHDMITSMKGSCEKTVGGIRKLRDMGIGVTISCPVMKANLKNFTKVLDFGKEVGAPVRCSCYLTMDMDFDRKNDGNRLSQEEQEWFCRTLWHYKKDNGTEDFSFRISERRNDQAHFPHWYAEQHPCGAHSFECCINGNGDVCPCPTWNFVVGNIHHESLASIWQNSGKFKELRLLKNKDMGKCIDCMFIDYCPVCPAIKYNENAGRLDLINEDICRIAEINYNIENELREQC